MRHEFRTRRSIWIGKTVAAALLASVCCAENGQANGNLPPGFVYLSDIAPDIVQELRYTGPDNFTGRPVPGYASGACILAEPAALALRSVQEDLSRRGLSLKVFDCYRPRRSVAAFMRWAERDGGEETKTRYFPRQRKKDLIRKGFIARRSSHSRGLAVDVTLISLPRGEDPAPPDAVRSADWPCHRAGQADASGDELDMGTSFDCFDRASATRSDEIDETARANRAILLEAMTARGFRNYRKEWWHFSFRHPGFTKHRDFPVK